MLTTSRGEGYPNLRVQVIAQLARSVKHTHIHNRHLRPLTNPRSHNSRQRVIEVLHIRVQPRLLGLDNLRDDDHRIWHLSQYIINQQPQPARRIGIGLVGRVPAVEIISTRVQQNDVGLEVEALACDAADLRDGKARVALVVRVAHGARALRADEVDRVAAGFQVGEEALAVPVGAAAVDVAPGDGVAEREDAQVGCCAGGEVIVGEGGGEGEDFGFVSRVCTRFEG